MKKFAAVALLCLTATSSHAQLTQGVKTVFQTMDALEFCKGAIANPTKIFALSRRIQDLFRNDSGRYKDLSGDLAEKLGLLNYPSLGPEYLEFKPERVGRDRYDYYSITFKKLKKNECRYMSVHEVNKHFTRVEVNGIEVFPNRTQQEVGAVCASQWFWQDGKNEIKYVGY